MSQLFVGIRKKLETMICTLIAVMQVNLSLNRIAYNLFLIKSNTRIYRNIWCILSRQSKRLMEKIHVSAIRFQLHHSNINEHLKCNTIAQYHSRIYYIIFTKINIRFKYFNSIHPLFYTTINHRIVYYEAYVHTAICLLYLTKSNIFILLL